jgi:hypothetical protein
MPADPISSVALARCKSERRSFRRFIGWLSCRHKPLKRLIRRHAYPHQAEATVLMRGAAACEPRGIGVGGRTSPDTGVETNRSRASRSSEAPMKRRKRQVAFRPAVGSRKPNTRHSLNIATTSARTQFVFKSPSSNPSGRMNRRCIGKLEAYGPTDLWVWLGTVPSPVSHVTATDLQDGHCAIENRVIRALLELVFKRQQSIPAN